MLRIFRNDRPDKRKVIDSSWYAHISFSWMAVVAQLGNHRIWPTILRNWLVSCIRATVTTLRSFPYFPRTFHSRTLIFCVDQSWTIDCENFLEFYESFFVEIFMIFLKKLEMSHSKFWNCIFEIYTFRFFSRRYIMS